MCVCVLCIGLGNACGCGKLQSGQVSTSPIPTGEGYVMTVFSVLSFAQQGIVITSVNHFQRDFMLSVVYVAFCTFRCI